MIILTHIPYDVNDEIDLRHELEDQWQHDASHVPAYFDHLTEQGVEPEAAADWVDGCVEADRVARLGKEGAEAMDLIMEINYGDRIPA